MQKQLIIFISVSLLCVCFFIFIYTEGLGAEDAGRVLGVNETFEQNIIRSKLSLSDVLSQEFLPPLVKLKDKKIIPQKNNDSVVPVLPVTGAIAIDNSSNEILFEQNANKVAPIASISKLMTALVFLDFEMDMENKYQVKKSDYRNGGHQYVAVGDVLKIKDLFSLSLIASANTATIALVSASGHSLEEFVEMMNKKAKSLGLENTGFRDPIGFSAYNVSTARELAVLIKTASERIEIKNRLASSEYECKTDSGKKRFASNTNKLLSWTLPDNINVIGGKTGYTALAGNCFAGNFNINNKHDITTIVLGAKTENERFKQSLALAKWVKASYEWIKN